MASKSSQDVIARMKQRANTQRDDAERYLQPRPGEKIQEYVDRVARFLAGNMIDSMRSFVQQEDRARADWQIVRCGLALCAYKTTHGSYPKTLDDLIPAYLSDSPFDQYNGEPLHYKTVDSGFKLYSVGKNLKDDGGESSYPADDISIVVKK